MDKAFHDLFRKCEALQEGEFLYTTFGAEHYYKIQRTDDGYFNIAEFRNKWAFQKEGRLESQDSFNSVETLKNVITRNPRWYAENYFSRKLVHMDNWINFVNAFGLGKLEVYELSDGTNYFYSKVKIV